MLNSRRLSTFESYGQQSFSISVIFKVSDWQEYVSYNLQQEMQNEFMLQQSVQLGKMEGMAMIV